LSKPVSIYVRAPRPITKLARVNKKKEQKNLKRRILYYSNNNDDDDNNNNNSISTNQNYHLEAEKMKPWLI
jgi:hypothetical protein